MKIIGIIIVVLCVIFNMFVGLFLFGSSLSETVEINGIEMEEKIYDQYGFRILVPKDFISQGPSIELNILDAFYLDTEEDEFDPVLQIYIYGETPEGNITSSEEYKMISEKDFKENSNLDYEYQDGGIMTNSNGVKIYYNTVSIKTDDVTITKSATFYYNNNEIMVFWTDDPTGFETSVTVFDKIIDSIQIY